MTMIAFNRIMIAAALAIAATAIAADGKPGQKRTAKADEQLAEAIDGRTAGEPVSCVNGSRLAPQIIDRQTIVHRDSGRRIWVNTLPGNCPSLRPGATLIVEMQGGGQLCRNDLVRALEPGTTIPGPYCRLGDFTPYTRAR